MQNQAGELSIDVSRHKAAKIALSRYSSMRDRICWRLKANVPGEFPFTAGVFPFEHKNEDPTRMFAGDGSAECTNLRFHLLAEGQPTVCRSTAIDAVTLYGEDPGLQPDIYGKVGEAVYLCSLLRKLSSFTKVSTCAHPRHQCP